MSSASEGHNPVSRASSLAVVPVALAERSYDIEIGQGTLAETGRFLLDRRKCAHAVVIADEHVVEPHAQVVVESLCTKGVRTDLLTVPAGETSKSVEQATRLWDALLACGADRKSVVVAVGGGVVGDLAGFVAATFGRGLAFLQIPTSLLAQVDSSVGGKVGINLPGGKNLVGAFWQPCGVLIDLDVLGTLPVREYISGLAEVVKYGVILDAEFFAWLEQQAHALKNRDSAALARVIARSCELKAEIVRHDEREETGLRAVLNYGHTFAHAIEAVAGYGQYFHGEAVSIGMVCAAELALRMHRIDAAFVQRQRDLLATLGLPVAFTGLDLDALLATMQRDKKVEYGRLRFVLPRRLGQVELVDGVSQDLVRATWQDVRAS
jgi:3-dehydroquinate synthase